MKLLYCPICNWTEKMSRINVFQNKCPKCDGKLIVKNE